MINNRHVRECTHQLHHEHGTPAAHRYDGCRCRLCAEAAAFAVRVQASTRLSGLVDATPARDHLKLLIRRGISLRRISELTGLAYRGDLLNIQAGAPRIQRSAAERILAIHPDPVLYAHPNRPLDATGTRRRLQALVRIGYTQTYLAGRLGIQIHNIHPLMHGETMVNARTARRVRAIYDELWATPQTGPDATRATNLAIKHGWVSPLAWDDEDIDRPKASPRGGPTSRRALTRAWTHIDDVEHLIRAGVSVPEVVRRCGYSSAESLMSRLERANRRDLIAIFPGARSLYSGAGN